MTTNSNNSYQQVQRILFLILLANFLVAAVKLIFGMLIHSSSLTADGFHSFADGAGNIIGLSAVRFAAIPEDAEHPYGHDKLETPRVCLQTFLPLEGSPKGGRPAKDKCRVLARPAYVLRSFRN